VLFHGLTNCPQQFDEFARLLHARGENVYVPRLPHHGHKDRLTRAIGNLTAREIERAATDAAGLAADLGEHVSALGISVGATMALWLAQTGGVENAVAVAPFLMIPFAPRRPGMLFLRVLAALPNRFMWWDPRIKEAMRPDYAYPGFWTHALAECVFAGNAIFTATARKPPVAARGTIVVNADDPAVNNAPARELAVRWRAQRPSFTLAVWDDAGKVHDIVDPSTYPAARTLVYPRLAALLEP
jgi:alpha-beta hydrolase superfamily lysophospholipase